MTEVDITEENFEEFFFDVRKHKPKKGQVLARYMAIADLVDSGEKRDVIELLRNTNKVIPTTNVMKKLLFACELDSYTVPRQIVEDLISGMSVDDVAAKPYRYKVEIFFYTKPEHIPRDDPHWNCISLLNLDNFLEHEGMVIKSKVVTPD